MSSANRSDDVRLICMAALATWMIHEPQSPWNDRPSHSNKADLMPGLRKTMLRALELAFQLGASTHVPLHHCPVEYVHRS